MYRGPHFSASPEAQPGRRSYTPLPVSLPIPMDDKLSHSLTNLYLPSMETMSPPTVLRQVEPVQPFILQQPAQAPPADPVPEKTPVNCNVYWMRGVQFDDNGRAIRTGGPGLSWGRKFVKDVLGVYHLGLEVGHTEYTFGNYHGSVSKQVGPPSSGVTTHVPKKPGPQCVYKETVLLGTTTLPPRKVMEIAAELGRATFKKTAYHRISRNCVDFCQALAARLGVDEIPMWCYRGAATAKILGLGVADPEADDPGEEADAVQEKKQIPVPVTTVVDHETALARRAAAAALSKGMQTVRQVVVTPSGRRDPLMATLQNISPVHSKTPSLDYSAVAAAAAALSAPSRTPLEPAAGPSPSSVVAGVPTSQSIVAIGPVGGPALPSGRPILKVMRSTAPTPKAHPLPSPPSSGGLTASMGRMSNVGISGNSAQCGGNGPAAGSFAGAPCYANVPSSAAATVPVPKSPTEKKITGGGNVASHAKFSVVHGFGNVGNAISGSSASHITHSGFSQPGISQPGFSQPGLSQTGLSQSGFSQPGFSQPGYSHPGFSQHGYSQPGVSQPNYSQPGYTQQANAHSSFAQPGFAARRFGNANASATSGGIGCAPGTPLRVTSHAGNQHVGTPKSAGHLPTDIPGGQSTGFFPGGSSGAGSFPGIPGYRNGNGYPSAAGCGGGGCACGAVRNTAGPICSTPTGARLMTQQPHQQSIQARGLQPRDLGSTWR
eukprot:TRINITY_DN67428_c0_g1_i1.p1 TRINITY_DN67428_c0_g1~~TRINITY_DN67428_c0_g1_i1.p1  ORF type:complete len:717 (+),score=92.65 TRINITY_DN67428_c0_g1_i1:68-2218(+)